MIIFTVPKSIRTGIEKEIWVMRNLPSGKCSAYSIRNEDAFCKKLFELRGDFEYQQNMFELRTLEGAEEKTPLEAEIGMQKRINSLRKILKRKNPNIMVLCSGAYQGPDEPPIDLSQSEDRMGKNVFWSEFNLVFPADATTRYTAADQISLSYLPRDEKKLAWLYNALVGLSPLFIYAFSTSSAINSVPISGWNRRQQIISSKGIRSGDILPGTYPLRNLQQYKSSLDTQLEIMNTMLSKQNPTFFNDGRSPRSVIAEYRGKDWGFVKLCTDQVVRFNQQSGWENAYLELRCIDAQECSKATAALAWLCKNIAQDTFDISGLLPTSEDELRNNIQETTLYGPNARIYARNRKLTMPEYIQLASSVFSVPGERYSDIILDRLKNPPAKNLRDMRGRGINLISVLDKCLAENKTLLEEQ